MKKYLTIQAIQKLKKVKKFILIGNKKHYIDDVVFEDTDYLVWIVLEFCSNLDQLEFKNCLLSINCMENISKQQNIHTLDLENCAIGEDKLEDLIINSSTGTIKHTNHDYIKGEISIPLLKNLRYLRIKATRINLNLTVMGLLAEECTALESFLIDSHDFISNISKEAFGNFLDKRKDSLKFLKINGDYFRSAGEIRGPYDDSYDWPKSLSKCMNLQKLIILEFYFAKDEENIAVAISKLKQLRHLELDDSIQHESMALMFANQNLQNLVHIDLTKRHDYSSVLDKDLVCIANGCPNLEYLFFRNCDDLAEETIVFLSKNCKNLKKLIFPRSNSKKLKEETIAKFCQNLPECELNMDYVYYSEDEDSASQSNDDDEEDDDENM